MNKITQFFRDVWAEVRKVSYPSRDELIGSTWVVVTSVFVMSFYLGAVDLVLTKLVQYLLR